MNDNEQTQQKEQRPEAQTNPDTTGEARGSDSQPEPTQAAPSGVPVSPYPLPPPKVNPDGTITYDIGEK